MRNVWGLLVVTALAVVCTPRAGAQQPGNGQSMASGAYEQQLSYTLGLSIGRDMRADEVPIDLAALVAGIRDAMQNARPKLSDGQREAVIVRFQQEMQQKAQSRMSDAATMNKQKGEAFLAENGKKEGVQTTPSGLQYRIVTPGTGATPTARDTVRCHYEGTLIDGSVFDSSYRRGQPAEFPVGGVIAGWTEALQMMKVGAKWEVYLPSDIAYGARGAGGSIGPNETLIFTIELLDVVD